MSTKVVSLLSNWYSGATLLSILLGSHSELVCNGETFPFGSEDPNIYECTCGKKLINCQYYSYAGKPFISYGPKRWDRTLFRMLPAYSQSRLINMCLNSLNFSILNDKLVSLYPPYRAALSKYLRCHKIFMDRGLTYYSAIKYVDGTKAIRRADLFAKYENIRLKVLYLVRDGRAFCYSYVKNMKLAKNELSIAANMWLKHIQIVDRFHRRNPGVPFMVLRYEDLCRAPDEMCNRLCQFIGIRNENIFDELHVRSERHILGNRMRLNFGGSIVEDISWQNVLSLKERKLIEELMAEGLDRYGYR